MGRTHSVRRAIASAVLICLVSAGYATASNRSLKVANEWECSLPYFCQVYGVKYCKDFKPVCPAKSCGATRGLIDTPKILNLEVLSYVPGSGSPNHGPLINVAADCCNSCTAMKGCNVWNYCWDKNGCGEPGSCTAFNAKYPLNAKGGPLRGALSIGCMEDGRFYKNHCILRQASNNLTSLKSTGSKGAHSWTSGILTETG